MSDLIRNPKDRYSRTVSHKVLAMDNEKIAQLFPEPKCLNDIIKKIVH